MTWVTLYYNGWITNAVDYIATSNTIHVFLWREYKLRRRWTNISLNLLYIMIINNNDNNCLSRVSL